MSFPAGNGEETSKLTHGEWRAEGPKYYSSEGRVRIGNDSIAGG